MQFKPAGDRALVVEFGHTIDPDVVAMVRRLDQQITSAQAAEPDGLFSGLLETVPTFRSLAIVFDPLVTNPERMADAVLTIADEDSGSTVTEQRCWRLPVVYGNERGPDLAGVADAVGLTSDEVIALHVDTPVSVYLLGFMPGFAFMGDTDARLQLPRRSEPRVRVPAGSVALALTLTAIYPWESPGGWHLIGQSAVPLFDADRQPAALLAPGDSVRFRAVQEDEHLNLVDELGKGKTDWSQFLDTAHHASA